MGIVFYELNSCPLFHAHRREEKIGELINSYTVYDDLIEKSNKGIGFYKKLEGTVTKLLAKTKGVVKANHGERQEKYRKKYRKSQKSVLIPFDLYEILLIGCSSGSMTFALARIALVKYLHAKPNINSTHK